MRYVRAVLYLNSNAAMRYWISRHLFLDLLLILRYATHMNEIKWGCERKICKNSCEIDGSQLGLGLVFIFNHTFLSQTQTQGILPLLPQPNKLGSLQESLKCSWYFPTNGWAGLDQKKKNSMKHSFRKKLKNRNSKFQLLWVTESRAGWCRQRG